ncbi:MAG: hypothetical protein HXY40_06330 [Chloroflexi bacterium]|nr:hypothetical protein [Chloroflexota bacterium]
MLTYKLWNVLKHPYRQHPVFHHTLRLRRAGIGDVSWLVKPLRRGLRALRARAQRGTALRVLLFLAALPALAILLLALLAVGVPLLIIGLPLLLPIAVNAHGLSWAVGIGTLIATERDRGTYDLLCITPAGPWPVNWAIISGYAHHDRTLFTLNQRRAWQLLILWVLLPFVASIGLLQPGQMTYSALLIPRFVIYLLALTVVLFIDQFQSIVLGVLLDIWLANSERSTHEMRLLIMSMYVLLQALTHLSALLLGFGLLPLLLNLINFRAWWNDLLIAAVCVGAFFLLHEALIRLLWRVACRQIGPEPETAKTIGTPELDPLLSGTL